MSDAQLKLMLVLMLSELSATIDEVSELMPEDAERESVGDWVKKPEFANKFVILASEETHDWQTTQGDYLALEPLRNLVVQWQQRIEAIGDE